jgi:Sec-independent protein translocase protein TatA
MGCSTCKQKKESNNTIDVESPPIDLIPESFANGDFGGNILFKIIAFVVVIIAIPFIILVLIGQVFLTFFIPKLLPKATKKLKGGFMSIFKKYAEFKYNRTMKKREKQFRKNRGYENGSELVDIEDLSSINVHKNNKNK